MLFVHLFFFHVRNELHLIYYQISSFPSSFFPFSLSIYIIILCEGLICIDDGDDETHWQDRVSSGFDRLVAFASIELTKSRRSIEDGAPSTSPDSGINHSSDGRTFLSSSSSSSQIDEHLR